MFVYLSHPMELCHFTELCANVGPGGEYPYYVSNMVYVYNLHIYLYKYILHKYDCNMCIYVIIYTCIYIFHLQFSGHSCYSR